MTRDEIINMAREAVFQTGVIYDRNGQPAYPLVQSLGQAGCAVELERFAALVAAAEREACAKVCEAIDTEYGGEDVHASWCSQAIRARGEK